MAQTCNPSHDVVNLRFVTDQRRQQPNRALTGHGNQQSLLGQRAADRRDQPGEVSHIDRQDCPHLVGDRADTLLACVCGDITYLWTLEGWLYMATVIDLATRMAVGLSFSDRMTADLPIAALASAWGRGFIAGGAIFHSDRGVQYAAYAYRQRLASLGIRQSMSRKGDPYDNAVAENFFSCLKCECVHLRHFASRAHAMADVFAYIETFYNPVRPHSSIGWRPPDAFARALSEHPAA